MNQHDSKIIISHHKVTNPITLKIISMFVNHAIPAGGIDAGVPDAFSKYFLVSSTIF